MTAATQDLSSAGVHATADMEKGTVNVVAEIAAKPEAVFRALTDPAEVVKWWGAEGVYRTERFESDLRPGGKWMSYIAAPEGSEYITIDPPRLLEFTWSPSWDGFQVTRVRYEIEPTATGSRLTVIHTGFEARPEMVTPHGEGWVRVIGWLTEFVQR